MKKTKMKTFENFFFFFLNVVGFFVVRRLGLLVFSQMTVCTVGFERVLVSVSEEEEEKFSSFFSHNFFLMFNVTLMLTCRVCVCPSVCVWYCSRFFHFQEN